jgi:hypothetical protein
VDAVILRLLVLDDLAMNIQSIDTIRGVEGFADEHALAVAIASAIEDGASRRRSTTAAPSPTGR